MGILDNINKAKAIAALKMAGGAARMASGAAMATGAAGLFVLMLAAIGKAQNDGHKYRQWMKMWKAANGEDTRRRPVKLRPLLMLLVCAATFAAWVLYPSAVRSMAPGLVTLAGLLGFCVVTWKAFPWLLRRTKRGPGADKPFTVAIVAPRASLPTLATAYRSLPGYCAAMFRGPQ